MELAEQNSYLSADIVREQHNNENNQDATNNFPNNDLQSKLKRLYRCQNEIPKVVEIDEEKLIQSWDNHYVKLKLLLKPILSGLENCEEEDYREAELENIFKSDNLSEMRKILFLGLAGAGKSALLQYICYKWGKQELWSHKFDFVFRIQLKYLLNNDWKSHYDNKSELEVNKLACFIHYNLRIQYFTLGENVLLQNDEVSFDEISGLKDKVVLLVDDYSAVSHLADKKDAIDFHNIMKAIYDNHYTNMSSRPNTLSNIKPFDYIMENNHVDLEKHINFIYEFNKADFKSCVGLISFLERNCQVREICGIPINMVLLCLVWTDENIQQSFAENFDVNINLLYYKVIFWLGARYLENFEENWSAANIAPSNVFGLDIIQALQNIAFDTFVEERNWFNKTDITKYLGKELTIRHLLNFGLIKADIHNSNYQFIHSTFQDFFAALFLNRTLRSNDEKDIKLRCKLINLIGQQRNKKRNLMVLKFLAGSVSNKEFEKCREEFAPCRDDQSKDELVKRCWEAFTCNIDGVLEFDLEAKITLIMHLLEQSKVNGKFDERIPNLEIIIETVEKEVLKDISKWQVQIIESGFLSDNIKFHLLDLINNMKFSPNTIVAVEIVVSLINKISPDERKKVLSKLNDCINSSNWQLKKLGLQYINTLLHDEINEDVLEKLMEFAGDENLKECASNYLLKVINLKPSICETVLTRFFKTICNSTNNDAIKTSAVQLISKILQFRLLKCNEVNDSLIESILNHFFFGIEDIQINSSNKLIKIFSIGLEDLKDCIGYKYATITALMDLITVQHPKIDVVKISLTMMEKINDSLLFYCVIRKAISTIKELPENKIRHFFHVTCSIIIRKLGSKNDRDDILWSKCIECLLVSTNCLSSDDVFKLMKFLCNNINQFIKDQKQYIDFHKLIELCKLLFILSYKVEDACDKIYNAIKVLVNNIIVNQLDVNVSLTKIFNFIDFIICHCKTKKFEQICSLVENVFSLLDDIVGSSNFKNGTHDEVSQVHDYDIHNLLETTFVEVALEPVASSAIKILSDVTDEEKAIKDIISFFKELTNFSEYGKSIALTLMADFIEVIPLTMKTELAKEIVDFYFNFVKDNGVTAQLLSSLKSVAKLVQHLSPEFQNNFVNKRLLLPLEIIKNENVQWDEGTCTKYAAVDCLSEIISFSPDPEKHIKANVICKALIKAIEIESRDINVKLIKSAILKNINKLVVIITFSDSLKLMKSVGLKKSITPNNICESMETNDDIKMNNSTVIIRDALIKGLLDKFNSQDLKMDHKYIIDILDLISLCGGQRKCEKQLCEVATKKLEQITDETSKRDIQWVINNWKELSKKNESKQLFHQVLSKISGENEMNHVHRQFIVKCIENGLITTIRRDLTEGQEHFSYQLTFENISYSFTNTSRDDLENEINAALEHDNILTKQYHDYNPIFKNSGRFILPIAATDLVIKSLVNDDSQLTTTKWHLSLLHLSDQHKREPTRTFALIEKRDFFGYHEIYKLCAVDKRIKVTPYLLHPNEITTEFCRNIFGDMDYQYDLMNCVTSTYYVSLIDSLALDEGRTLISEWTSPESNTEYGILHERFQKYFSNISWGEYKHGENVIKVEKAFLLKLDDFGIKAVIKNSVIINMRQTQNVLVDFCSSHKAVQHDFHEKCKILTDKVYKLELENELNQSHLIELLPSTSKPAVPQYEETNSDDSLNLC